MIDEVELVESVVLPPTVGGVGRMSGNSIVEDDEALADWSIVSNASRSYRLDAKFNEERLLTT